jgi:hypothetical protein
VYAPIASVELARVVLYFGGWGPRGAVYALIRVLSFAAVALSVIDVSRHKAFYNRRRYARRSQRKRNVRWMVGLVVGAGGAMLAATSFVLLLAHDSDGAGGAAFFATLLMATAAYLVGTAHNAPAKTC